jgi:Mn2+/Fe2+ NRAMP family transporter
MILALGASIVLIPGLPLIKVMWFSQIVNCLLLPVVMIFMIQLINDDDIMGTYKNSLWMNIVTYIGTGVLILLNVVLLYNAFAGIFR